MAYKLVIFDCDGVLVDSEKLGNNVLAEMLAGYGHRICADEAESRFRGVKFAQCLETLERESGIQLPESFESDLRQRMSSVFQAQLRPVAGALRLVQSLQLPFCVASSGPRKKIEENLRITQLYPHFAGKIFSAYEYNSWKPDPGLFLSAAKHFAVAPGECLVIEDSAVGVSAAIAAGMTVFALNPAMDHRCLTGAHAVFTSLEQIRQVFVAQGLSRE